MTPDSFQDFVQIKGGLDHQRAPDADHGIHNMNMGKDMVGRKKAQGAISLV